MNYSFCNIEQTKMTELKKSFLDNYPLLKKEWDYERNSELKLYPEKFSCSSGIKVWWKCSKKHCHKWDATISKRARGNRGCPVCYNRKICDCACNSLYNAKVKNIEQLRLEWDEEKNGSMKLYATGSSKKKVWWRCSSGNPCHIWDACPNSRTTKKGSNCPFCSVPIKKICVCGCNSVYNSEVTNIDRLRTEWDEEKNGSMKLYAPHSGISVWWRCSTGKECHKWNSTIDSRTGQNNTGCPLCSSKQICLCGCNSLYYSEVTNIDQLRLEWDEDKNGSMKLYATGSSKRVWWKCSLNKNHFWESTIYNRTVSTSTNCPFCSQSKLEKKLEETLQRLQKTTCKTVTYELQKKFSCTKNVNHLPYDAHISYKGYDISIELQGVQHFKFVEYFHRNGIESFIKRLETDNKKSHNTLKRGHCFLSISYLCLEDVEKILSEFLTSLEECDTLLSYYITGEKCLYYKRTGQTVFYTDYIGKLEDEEFQIYQVYSTHIKTLVESGKPNFSMSNCKICDDSYLQDYLTEHYNTPSHIQNRERLMYDLGETYPNLFTVTEDGDPVLEEVVTVVEQSDDTDK
jgi:hypothetical protein